MASKARTAPSKLACLLVASLAGACGTTTTQSDFAAPVVPCAPRAPEAVLVDGIVVHAGTRQSLTTVQRAYLARMERLIVVYADAPDPPATYTHDAAAYLAWEPTLRAYFAPVEDETRRLVAEHPRPADESPEARRFHALLELVEARLRAQLHAMNVGGRAGGSFRCPHDPPSHYAFAVAQLASTADRCLVALTGAPDVFFSTALRCGRLIAEAREIQARAIPPGPDECMEQMPSPGE